MLFTAINFGGKVFADDPTILDISSFSDDIVTIGNDKASITMNTSNGAIVITGRTLNIKGNEYVSGSLIETNIQSTKTSIGDGDGLGNSTSIVIDDFMGTIDLNETGNIEQ